MNSQRVIVWTVGVAGVALMIAFVLYGRVRDSEGDARPQLPALVTRQNLPALFNHRVQSVTEEIRSHPNNLDLVRALARLYHANGLHREARSCYATVAARKNGLTARDHYYLADIAQNEGNL